MNFGDFSIALSNVVETDASFARLGKRAVGSHLALFHPAERSAERRKWFEVLVWFSLRLFSPVSQQDEKAGKSQPKVLFALARPVSSISLVLQKAFRSLSLDCGDSKGHAICLFVFLFSFSFSRLFEPAFSGSSWKMPPLRRVCCLLVVLFGQLSQNGWRKLNLSLSLTKGKRGQSCIAKTVSAVHSAALSWDRKKLISLPSLFMHDD
jgi:hypothetical protein